MKIEDIQNFYRKEIEEDFYPYWKEQEDLSYGGVLNCINNQGTEKISNEKFTWSQGRYLWVLSKISELKKNDNLKKIDEVHLKEQAKKTFDFIKNNAFTPEGTCYYLLDQKGEPLIDPVSGLYEASIFADCFAMIGISQYIRVFGVKEELGLAKKLYGLIKSRITSNNFKTEPYPIPEGYKNHSIPMIMLNTTYEYMIMLESLGENLEEDNSYLLELVEELLTEFYDDDLIREFISNEEREDKYLLDRHINPGHTIEDLWFIIEALTKYGDLNSELEKITSIAKKTFNIGWDKEYGGLFRFVDKDGGKPKGEVEEESYVKLIQDTHDMKLWWPHSELLYLPLLLHKHHGDQYYLEWYQKVHDYVFEVFPEKNQKEWVQIRERNGTPVEKLVALPVKDPFHILRNYIKIIEL